MDDTLSGLVALLRSQPRLSFGKMSFLDWSKGMKNDSSI
jgi:hypothetical protein